MDTTTQHRVITELLDQVGELKKENALLSSSVSVHIEYCLH
jgi:hypothetical protein